MSTDNKNNLGAQIFFSLLQISFIVLKLVGVVDWNWWLVLLPTIIGAGLVAIFITLTVILKAVGGDK